MFIILLLNSYAQAKVGSCSLKELGLFSDAYYECLKQEAIKTDSIEDIDFYAAHLRGGSMDDDLFWYKKAVAKGDIKAIAAIANVYRGYHHPKIAIKWYKKAVKKGYKGAMESLTKLMQETYGSDTVDMYEKEIEEGRDVYWNELYLSNYYMRKEEFKDAKAVYEEIIKKFPQRKAKMLFAIGNLYKPGWLSDKEKEIAYYKQAAQLGDTDAMYNLGVYYGNVVGDYKKAEEYFRAAGAPRMVCFMYETKLNEYKKAEQCYKKVAQSGRAIDLFALGYMYMKTLNDYPKAIKYYKQAYELGYSGGALNIGYTYREYIHNQEKAIYWYEKAADMDEDGARRYLMKIGDLKAPKGSSK